MVDATVDDVAIANLSKNFDTWTTQVQTLIDTVSNLTVTAGDFTEAHTLETLVAKRAGELVKNLTNIKNALMGLSYDINQVAIDYKNTADDTTITASEFDKLTKDVGNNLPGFTKLK